MAITRIPENERRLLTRKQIDKEFDKKWTLLSLKDVDKKIDGGYLYAIGEFDDQTELSLISKQELQNQATMIYAHKDRGALYV